MVSHTDSLALLSDVERQFDRANHRAGGSLDRRVTGLIEPLWHERDVWQAGCLTRIAVPLAGPEQGPQYADQLAATLDHRWSGRLDLTPGARIISVTAHLEQPSLGLPTLVLEILTDQEAPAESFAATRAAIELRRAIRDLRRGYALPVAA